MNRDYKITTPPPTLFGDISCRLGGWRKALEIPENLAKWHLEKKQKNPAQYINLDTSQSLHPKS